MITNKEILFVINSISNKGGSERVAINLANELSENYLISIAYLNGENRPAYHLDPRIKTIKVDGKTLFSQAKNLKKLIKNGTYKKIVSNNMGKLSLLLAILIKNKPIISLEHISFSSKSKLIRLITKILYTKIRAVVCLTSSDAKCYKLFHSNVITIPNFNSFTSKKFEYSISSKQILSIGRLTHQKGFDMLLKIWSIASKELPEWNLKIIGDGPLKSNLESLISKEKIKNIEILPSTNEIENHYKNSAIYAMSSRYEGLPMVLLEAQCFSLPIISFNCPHGPKDIISSGYNGFLIENFSTEDFAKKMIEMCKSKETRISLSKNSYKNANKFEKQKIIKKWKELINEI